MRTTPLAPSTPMVGLDFATPTVVVRAMLTTDRAIDLFVGDLASRGCSEGTRATYSRLLDKFADRLPQDQDVSKITTDDCRRFLALWNSKAAGTRAHAFSVLSSFFTWLYKTERVARNPLERMSRPKRQRPEDLDVTTVSTDDVRALLAAALPGPEKNAIAILAHLGPRRRAVAHLRLRDYNRKTGEIRFHEKGGKVIWKPIPAELGLILDASITRGDIWEAPYDYLVPPRSREHSKMVRKGERDDRIVWKIVKDVALRAGVEAHVHALRAAFAVYYLEQNERDTYGLQNLLGHSSANTTQVYLRRYDKRDAMAPVRTLSWARTEGQA